MLIKETRQTISTIKTLVDVLEIGQAQRINDQDIRQHYIKAISSMEKYIKKEIKELRELMGRSQCSE